MESWPKPAVELLAAHRTRFVSLIRRWHLGNQEEDILSEVSIRVGTMFHTCTENPAGWAYSVFLNVLRHRRRDVKKEELHRRRIWVDSLVPEEEPHRLDTLLVVARLLSCLSDRQLELVELLYWQNLSLDEAAGRLGVRNSTCRAVLFRALRKLRREVLRPKNRQLADIAGRDPECLRLLDGQRVKTGVRRSPTVRAAARRRPAAPAPEAPAPAESDLVPDGLSL